MENIQFDDFLKVEMRVGEVKEASKVEGSEKLLKLIVDFGEDSLRQVVSGIAKTFTEPDVLVGKQFVFVANLEPRVIFGLESQAMIVATHKKKRGGDEVVIARPSKKVKPGSVFG